jgi:hypothetical protein
MSLVHFIIPIVFFHKVLTYSLVLLFQSLIHILMEQTSEELSSPLYLYSPQLGFGSKREIGSNLFLNDFGG